MKVYISPSTQEKNITALGNTEEDLMHGIADELVPILQKHNITVLRGRREQSLEQMVAESNSNKVDIHVALHSNAYNKVTRGAEVFHYPTSLNGKRLADLLYKRILEISPVVGRGVKTTKELYEIVRTNAPAALIEIDFHDNLEGAKWISDNSRQIAVAIAKAICDYFNIKYIESVNNDELSMYKNAIEQIKEIVENFP